MRHTNHVRTVLLVSFLAPMGAFAASVPAASFSTAHSLLATSSSPGNAYIGGVSVVVTAPVTGDLSAVGGGIVVAAPVAGDELLFAGSIRARAPVEGDFRAVGGSITVEKPVMGDMVAFGLSVYDAGRAGGSVFIGALNATVADGASGPVIVYGNNVSLAGTFTGDVTVTAGSRFTLAPNTVIHGKLSYEAPEAVNMPVSATVIGGVTYRNISYLPDAGTSRVLALASVGLFLFVRILGALLLAGLLAGLFPRLARAVVGRAYEKRPRDILLTMLLGFALFAATPILLVLLLLTFVGIGIAFLVFAAYLLTIFLALIYAGILLGGLFARWYAQRKEVLWHDGVLGMLILSLISLVPIVGPLVLFLIATFAAGALLLIFSDFAFSGEGRDSEML